MRINVFGCAREKKKNFVFIIFFLFLFQLLPRISRYYSTKSVIHYLYTVETGDAIHDKMNFFSSSLIKNSVSFTIFAQKPNRSCNNMNKKRSRFDLIWRLLQVAKLIVYICKSFSCLLQFLVFLLLCLGTIFEVDVLIGISRKIFNFKL